MLSQSCGSTTLRERQASGKSLLCSKGIPPSRACGEKGERRLVIIYEMDTFPRMWGKRTS